MRVSVTFTVRGSTLEEIVKLSHKEWKSLSGEESLPPQAEIQVVDSTDPAYDYEATVYVKTKREDSGK
jgi:hypothetical protein